MKRNVSLAEISDGRLYTANDMVKADCKDCAGCSACCQGMGSSIVLDPYDIWRLCTGLGTSFEQLMQGAIELSVADGLILPNLRLAGENEACYFLNEEGRCSIHPYRPGICRLFPLGRYYEDGGFRYFLQTHECRMENRMKVKVRKWVDTPQLPQYEQYIADWHNFLLEVEKGLEELSGDNADTLRKNCSMLILREMYLTAYAQEGFYEQFYERLARLKEKLGMV